MRYKPLFDTILVEEIEDKEKIVMDRDLTTPIKAKVIDIGDEKTWIGNQYRPHNIKIGDTLLFYARDAKKIRTEKKDLFILKIKDILVKLIND